MNYYNELDQFAAAWLRELIKSNLIAKGEVDERDIRDIKPSELRGYTQCHFFAGIGVWSYALRQAGWPDDRPVWTGSCPCQPFSAAGKRKGIADERHLWPAFFHLIQSGNPDVIFGEQVASKDGLAWFDTVSTDLEATGYTLGAADLCAAGFGAPHIRQRLYFVAESNTMQRNRRGNARQGGRFEDSNRRILEHTPQQQVGIPGRTWEPRSTDGVGLADAQQYERGQKCSVTERSDSRSGAEGLEQRSLHGSASGLGLSDSSGPQPRNESAETLGQRNSALTAGFWADCTWLPCIDGKARPVEPGTFPLAHGSPNRVGRLRGYGNAIVAPQAQAFIEAFLETEKENNDNN